MKTLFSFLLIFTFAAIASGQERVIDKTEFDAVVTGGHGHQLKWKGEKYRMTLTTSSTVAGRPQTDFSSKTIVEYGPSMESRRIMTSMFGGNPATMREILRVGDRVYTRSGNGTWTRKEYVEPGPAKEREESKYKILSSKAEYRYLGHGKLINRPVHIYVKIERQTKINEKSGENVETESKNTYWVDEKGTIIKNEFSAETRGKITNQTSVLMEWEIDPSITFTEPVTTP